jgi:hypothetical protein
MSRWRKGFSIKSGVCEIISPCAGLHDQNKLAPQVPSPVHRVRRNLVLNDLGTIGDGDLTGIIDLADRIERDLVLFLAKG